MTPGPVEEVGKVAVGVIDALRASPIMIVLIIFNAMILALVFFSIGDRHRMDNEIMKLILAQQAQAQDLLSKCVVPTL